MTEEIDNGTSSNVIADVTQKLAKKESTGEMQGMSELYDTIRKRPLTIKAYPVETLGISSVADNVKTIHFIRHGQGFHNLTADLFASQGRVWEPFVQSSDNPYTMDEVMDAPLTQKGRDQARSLQSRINQAKELGDCSKIENTEPELIVSSTLCRALQTASIACEHLLEKEGNANTGIPCIAHELVREAAGVHVCDARRPLSQQKREFPWVDFDGIEFEEDTLFNQEHRETKMELGDRIYKFMEWLSKRAEKNLVVVSHSCWLLTLFNGVLECDDTLKPWFRTGEMRSVKLCFIDTK